MSQSPEVATMTMISFAALAHALYRASKGHGVIEHGEDATERETALVALRAALQEQGVDDVQIEGEHKAPEAAEIAALTPEQRRQALSMGLSLALTALRPHVRPLGREERKRQLEEHHDLIVRVADAVLTQAARYLGFPAEELETLMCVACLEGATDALCLLRPASRDLRRALHFLRRRRTTRTTH